MSAPSDADSEDRDGFRDVGGQTMAKWRWNLPPRPAQSANSGTAGLEKDNAGERDGRHSTVV